MCNIAVCVLLWYFVAPFSFCHKKIDFYSKFKKKKLAREEMSQPDKSFFNKSILSFAISMLSDF